MKYCQSTEILGWYQQKSFDKKTAKKIDGSIQKPALQPMSLS